MRELLNAHESLLMSRRHIHPKTSDQ